MVSTAKPPFDRVAPLLPVFGKTFYVGEKPGLAQIAKLGNTLWWRRRSCSRPRPW